MISVEQTQAISQAEQKIRLLSDQLTEAKLAVQQWANANQSLSRSAAEARANNQGSGRGFLGALLGPKFRGAMRSAAASSNAAIAKDVAAKRGRIAEGKKQAQELARRIQDELALAKQELKNLTVAARTRSQASKTKAKTTNESLNLLQKLKMAKDAGLLTDTEFEEKRRKLVEDL